MAPNKKTGRVGAAKLYVPNTTLYVLSRMVFKNFVAFVVFKILINLVSMKNLLNVNNCWHKQNLENCLTWPHIFFQCTIRISYCFYLIFGFLGCRKCCWFHIKWFFSKTRRRNMSKYAETCKGICGYNLVYNFLYISCH